MEEILIKFPSPHADNKRFTYYWETLLPDIHDRENLKKSHLQQLRVLCFLFVEYDDLQEFLELNGRTYVSVGRNGNQIKPRPEIALIKSCVSEIRNYSKMLDLVLVKDKNMNNNGDEKNDFA